MNNYFNECWIPPCRLQGLLGTKKRALQIPCTAPLDLFSQSRWGRYCQLRGWKVPAILFVGKLQ